MPGGKDLQNKSLDELKKQADAEYAAQETVFDRLWYSLNVTALYKQVSEARSKNKEPDAIDLDIEGDEAPEVIKDASEAYKKRHPDSFFLGDERERIKVPYDEETNRKGEELEEYVKRKTLDQEFSPRNVEELKKCYMIQGMMIAKIALEEEKEYEEKLKMFPADDPDREEKALYLQMNDTQSKAMSLDNSLKNFINSLSLESGGMTWKMFNESPVGNVDALKKMSMKEYFSQSWLPEEAQREYYETKRRKGLNIDENTSAYDAFRMEYEQEQQNIKALNPQYQVKEATDENILSRVKDKYNLSLLTYQQRFGIEVVKNSLGPEDKKRVDHGVKMYEWKEYYPPKHLRDWVEKEGQNLAYKNRPEQMNENFEFYGKEASPEKNIGVTETGLIGNTFDKLPENPSEYDRFVHEHIGTKALMDTPEERRNHLALVMAAKAAETSGAAFDRKVIEAFANGIKNNHVFKNVTDKEVSQALFNKEATLEFQKQMLRETYEVPKEEQTEYIRKMKELSKAMVPPKGQSVQYQALYASVKRIGDLDPNDPSVRTKLMTANEKMLNSVVSYQKGKKSMRSVFTDSQKRFDNSMDALSIMNDHVPGFRPYAKAQVDRTNQVRKVKEGHENFVDLKNFGVDRAKQHSGINYNISIQKPMQDLKDPEQSL